VVTMEKIILTQVKDYFYSQHEKFKSKIRIFWILGHDKKDIAIMTEVFCLII